MIMNFIFCKMSSDSVSAITNNLERFLVIHKSNDEVCSSNMLTIMGLEHACYAVRILPSFELFDAVQTPTSLLDAVFAVSGSILFCAIAPSVFFST